jgi:hypothetical protein
MMRLVLGARSCFQMPLVLVDLILERGKDMIGFYKQSNTFEKLNVLLIPFGLLSACKV